MKKSFSLKSCFVGIDVASTTLVASVYGQPATETIHNRPDAIQAWLKRLPADATIAVEATGAYHESLLQLAHASGRHCYLLNPKDVRHYALGTGARGKTDRVDAMLIARYVAKEHPHLHLWQPAPPAAILLGRLLTRRAKLVEAKGAILQSTAGLPALKTTVFEAVEKINALILVIEQQIESALAALPNGRECAKRLRSIPGVGLLTSAMLTNLFNRVPFANVDAVVAFAGLDPRANDSGSKRGRRTLSKRGPSELRRLLFNAAMSGAKTATWRPAYQSERNKGLPTTAALVILARKILRVAFALFKNNTTFSPQTQKIACTKP